MDASSKVKASTQQDGGKAEESKQTKDAPADPTTDAAEEVNPHEKAGTEIELKVTFFPDKSLESMVNLRNLHIFYESSYGNY